MEFIQAPPNVRDFFKRLNKLMTDFPSVVPLKEAAEFLDMDPRQLRAALHSGQEFGMGWKVNTRGEYYINSAMFYGHCVKPWSSAGLVQIVWEA